MANKVFSHFVPFFAFWPSEQPKKNQNFEKMKKSNLWYYHLSLCTTNDDHMMHVSWDMEHDRQNFLSLWTIFFPFTLENQKIITQKIKILKKWKNPKVYQKSWLYTILFLRYGMWWMYSQTCIRQPLLGPLKSGCLGQVAL